MQTFSALLDVWGSYSSIKHTSYEQHSYITRALVVCSAYLNENEIQLHKESEFLYFLYEV